MKKPGQKIWILFVIYTVVSAAELSGDSATILWYETPARHFTQSLPLGNGRLGMMIFGGVKKDRIVLNEESVWSGSPSDNNRPNAHKQLSEIRRLLQEGRNDEAERLVNQTFTCKGDGSGHAKGANLPFGCYQVLGNLSIEFETDPNSATDYRRRLDLSTALADVRYESDDVGYHRRYFTSAPDQVGVIRLIADKPAALTFGISL
ncbi:MAG: glycoside hydrolase family 95 protein, partial [Planctomycetota bacterium]